jgi:hypothetical protein
LEDEDIYPLVDSGDSVKKMLDENTYNFCKKMGEAIREAGIDRIRYSPKDKVVQFKTLLPVGMDASSVKVFYYSGNGILPKEYTTAKQVSPNWFSNVW